MGVSDVRESEIAVMIIKSAFAFLATSVLIGVVLTGVATCSGCTMEHDITLSLDLEDDCLLRFPECSMTSGYSCADADGRVDANCEVACVAARTLECGVDGPECFQLIGDSSEHVPVICTSRGSL